MPRRKPRLTGLQTVIPPLVPEARGAEDWTRTSTGLNPLGPEPSASTKFRHFGTDGVQFSLTAGHRQERLPGYGSPGQIRIVWMAGESVAGELFGESVASWLLATSVTDRGLSRFARTLPEASESRGP